MIENFSFLSYTLYLSFYKQVGVQDGGLTARALETMLRVLVLIFEGQGQEDKGFKHKTNMRLAGMQ